jgi:hypothetical protein
MTAPALVEFVYGIDSTVSDDTRFYRAPHVVKFRVVKKTPKRVYYEIKGWTRFVDRHRLETDGKVLRKRGGWWEPDLTVYLNPPAIEQHKAPSLADLWTAMADAHPDRGGTDEAFIAARHRYEQARTRETTA